MEEEGQTAEDGNQNKGNQRHLLYFPVAHPAINQHDCRRDNQCGGRRIDVIKFIKRKKTTSGKNPETASFFDSIINERRMRRVTAHCGLLANQHIQAE